MRRVRQLFKKEFLQLKRDRRSVLFFAFMPTVMLILFGYALSTDVKHLPTAVLDEDGHYLSRELVAVLENSEYFDVKYRVHSEEELQELLDGGKVKVCLVIPDDFSRDAYALEGAEVQILIDGSDPNSANTALNVGNACVQYLSTALSRTIKTSVIEAQPRIWYNPELRSANFLVPGIIGLVLQNLIPMMTVVGIVKERERGTIEQLITTPIKSWELMAGKLLPYVVIASGIVTAITVLGVLLFKVPINGNLIVFALFILVFLLVCLSLGLLFSTIAQNQQQGFQMVTMIGVPSILLSGLMFPRDAMPVVIQYVGNLLPLTYFIELVRGVTLKGVGIRYLWSSFVPLFAFELVILAVSIKKFKKKLG